ncbi:hypothetical protein [Mumia zhuanghuii]|nr:hypothetical protein [Mumia zhuanghuii]
MPGLHKAEFLAALQLYEEPGWVLLYKCEEHFLEMRSMFLDGEREMV